MPSLSIRAVSLSAGLLLAAGAAEAQPLEALGAPEASSTSSPGPVTSSAAPPIPTTTG